MKILIAGDWHSDIHETAAAQALECLGHVTVPFRWHRYFECRAGLWGRVSHAVKRIQNKFIIGPLVRRLNADFVHLALSSGPDVIFVYRGTHITLSSLRTIKRRLPNCVLVGYNNDDPFGPGQPRHLWRHFLAALPIYDLVLAYRHHNIDEFRAYSARRVELMRSWFIPDRNRRMELTGADIEKYACDVVFVGHYEADQRVACLEEIVRQGWRLKLFGHGRDWDPVLVSNPVLRDHVPVRPVWRDDYNRAVSGAKIALCFLSKLNRDTYTRRCFEIPAIGTVLLSEYSDDLATLYAPDKDAVFFRDKEELVAKIRILLANDELRESIASNGRQRVVADGHDVVSRMRAMVKWIENVRGGGR